MLVMNACFTLEIWSLKVVFPSFIRPLHQLLALLHHIAINISSVHQNPVSLCYQQIMTSFSCAYKTYRVPPPPPCPRFPCLYVCLCVCVCAGCVRELKGVMHASPLSTIREQPFWCTRFHVVNWTKWVIRRSCCVCVCVCVCVSQAQARARAVRACVRGPFTHTLPSHAGIKRIQLLRLLYLIFLPLAGRCDFRNFSINPVSRLSHFFTSLLSRHGITRPGMGSRLGCTTAHNARIWRTRLTLQERKRNHFLLVVFIFQEWMRQTICQANHHCFLYMYLHRLYCQSWLLLSIFFQKQIFTFLAIASPNGWACRSLVNYLPLKENKIAFCLLNWDLAQWFDFHISESDLKTKARCVLRSSREISME